MTHGQARALVKCGLLLLVAVTVGLSILQYRYLQSQGWSPVGRTATQWPSLLATGPGGWILSAAFAFSGVALACFAWVLFRDLSKGAASTRATAGALVLSAAGLLGVAFPADAATDPVTSWHAMIHNGLYPLVPAGILTSAALSATAADPLVQRRVPLICLLIVIAFLGLTAVDPVAQLARYPAFAAMFSWVYLLASIEYMPASRRRFGS